MLSQKSGPIGVFDSGYGGLTILKEIKKLLPNYDYLYLGDNARTPYGTRSFDIVYSFTLQAVKRLFEEGCHLVILACNTASAKALRSIQINDLPKLDDAIQSVGKSQGFTYIFDIARTSIPYINTDQSTDVTTSVKSKLGI